MVLVTSPASGVRMTVAQWANANRPLVIDIVRDLLESDPGVNDDVRDLSAPAIARFLWDPTDIPESANAAYAYLIERVAGQMVAIGITPLSITDLDAETPDRWDPFMGPRPGESVFVPPAERNRRSIANALWVLAWTSVVAAGCVAGQTIVMVCRH